MKQRIITALIAAAAFIPIVLYGGWPFTVLIYFMAAVGLMEALKMNKIAPASLPGLLSLILLFIILLPEHFTETLQQAGYEKMELMTLLVLLLLAYVVVSKNRFHFEKAAFCVLAALYVGFGFYYFMETREAGVLFVFFALFITWATDSGAYFVGRSYGRRKLWPEISPKKTIEGSIGGVLSAMAVAVLFALFADMGVAWPKLIIASAILSVFGQLGDLAESALKRQYGVKDSGALLPGHGGILDRTDSWLFVFPLVHLLQLV